MSGLGRVLIVGGSGQLGTELRRSFADAGNLVCPDRNGMDLRDEARIRAAVRSIEPDLILNAAAYTAVDRAEFEGEMAMAINGRAPRVLAEEAARRDILLVHYSTDYVFDGTKQEPWLETDRPNPLNVYGASKLAGEQSIERVGGKYLIFRTSWVYGPHGRNFLLTMLRSAREREELDIVDDQIGAPTSAFELANATRNVVGGALAGAHGAPSVWSGTYHMTCCGSTSWFGFAQAIFEGTYALRNGRNPTLNHVSSAAYPTPARRPLNSVLSNEKLALSFGVRLSSWRAALRSTLDHLSQYSCE